MTSHIQDPLIPIRDWTSPFLSKVGMLRVAETSCRFLIMACFGQGGQHSQFSKELIDIRCISFRVSLLCLEDFSSAFAWKIWYKYAHIHCRSTALVASVADSFRALAHLSTSCL